MKLKTSSLFQIFQTKIYKTKQKDHHFLKTIEIYLKMMYMGFQCKVQDFKSYLGSKSDLVESDIELILKQYKINLITYQIPPSVHTIGVLIIQIDEISEGGIQLEYDISRMKAKSLEKNTNLYINFDGELFFSTLIGFTPYWDYKPHFEYVSGKVTIKVQISKLI